MTADWPGPPRRQRERIEFDEPQAFAEVVEPAERDGGYLGLAVCRSCGYQLAAIGAGLPGSLPMILLELWPGAMPDRDRHPDTGLPYYRSTRQAAPWSHRLDRGYLLRDPLDAPASHDRSHIWVECPNARCGLGQELNGRLLTEALRARAAA